MTQRCNTRRDKTGTHGTPKRPPGLHTTSREHQTCSFERPGASNTTKIPRKDQQERENENCGGRGKKKREILALPPVGPPTFSMFGPPPFGALPFVVQKFNVQKLAEVEIGRSRKWPKSKMAEVDRARLEDRCPLCGPRFCGWGVPSRGARYPMCAKMAQCLGVPEQVYRGVPRWPMTSVSPISQVSVGRQTSGRRMCGHMFIGLAALTSCVCF